MNKEQTSDSWSDLSRRVAATFFGETRGRSVSRMLADRFETSVDEVHRVMKVGLAAAGLGLYILVRDR